MEKNKTKIVFMGTSTFAKEILNGLVEEGYNIKAIFTRPDKKIGREQILSESPVKKVATLHNIPIFQPENLDIGTLNDIKAVSPDIIIVAAYGKILPESLLGVPKFGSINIHGSLLPKYRGPSPIQNALMNGEKETGITIIKMNKGIDAGDILAQKSLAIDSADTTETLSEKLSVLGKKLLLETLPLLIDGKVKPQKQDNNKATFCQLIEREDGHIFWSEEAQIIFNKYRALYPWPGIFAFWKDAGKMRRIKFSKISIADFGGEKHKIGEVFRQSGQIGIQAAKGAIIIEEIQLEGKKPAVAQDLINGYPKFVGSILI